MFEDGLVKFDQARAAEKLYTNCSFLTWLIMAKNLSMRVYNFLVHSVMTNIRIKALLNPSHIRSPPPSSFSAPHYVRFSYVLSSYLFCL